MSHHTSDPVCQLCEEKIGQAHPYMAAWFRKVKRNYPNAHVSCGFRGEAEQNQAVTDQRSKLLWPKSAHNHMEGGRPLSLALDLFQIDEDGVGRWSPPWFIKLYADVLSDGDKIFWGGKWKSLGDRDHFEMTAI